VNRLSKMVHFFPCNKIKGSIIVTKMFFQDIVRLHGLPTSIIVDRDVKLMGNFWKILWSRLGMEFCLAYHPHTDG